MKKKKHCVMSVAKMPRLSNTLPANDTNGNGKQTENPEDWKPEDGTR